MEYTKKDHEEDEDRHKEHGFNWILMDSRVRDHPAVVELILVS